MKTKLPKRIYVRWEGEHDEQYMLAYEKPEDLCEENQTVAAGEYELKKTVHVVNKTTVESCDL